MKTQLKIKDHVWIHIGEPTLVKGRIVDILDLQHLNEGHKPDHKFYVIEIETGIENIYEVREYDALSLDERGPLNLYRKLKSHTEARYLKKLGIKVPLDTLIDSLSQEDTVLQLDEDFDEPTPAQISAALERSQEANKHTALSLPGNTKPKKRFYRKKTK
jgi:hypothetical protein